MRTCIEGGITVMAVTGSLQVCWAYMPCTCVGGACMCTCLASNARLLQLTWLAERFAPSCCRWLLTLLSVMAL
jgi:hypothetical protein